MSKKDFYEKQPKPVHTGECWGLVESEWMWWDLGATSAKSVEAEVTATVLSKIPTLATNVAKDCQ